MRDMLDSYPMSLLRPKTVGRGQRGHLKGVSPFRGSPGVPMSRPDGWGLF